MLKSHLFSKPNRKLHLALGGGGARALAHLGVLKVIENEKLPIGRLSGTSGGAIIAALYAQIGNIQEVIERVQKVLFSDTFSKIGFDSIINDQSNKHSHFMSIENILSKNRQF